MTEVFTLIGILIGVAVGMSVTKTLIRHYLESENDND